LPSELIAAFLEAQFAHADEVIARRIEVWGRYRDRLAGLAGTGAFEVPRASYDDRVPNGHLFYLLTDTLATRMALAAHLKMHDMLAVSHYVPLHSSPAGRKWGRACGEFKVTDSVSERLLRLPIYFGITDAQVDSVIDAVNGFYATGTVAAR
jgi:dTDP-4-amino-4,6-dideoxygalactose transaminase